MCQAIRAFASLPKLAVRLFAWRCTLLIIVTAKRPLFFGLTVIPPIGLTNNGFNLVPRSSRTGTLLSLCHLQRIYKDREHPQSSLLRPTLLRIGHSTGARTRALFKIVQRASVFKCPVLSLARPPRQQQRLRRQRQPLLLRLPLHAPTMCVAVAHVALAWDVHLLTKALWSLRAARSAPRHCAHLKLQPLD